MYSQSDDWSSLPTTTVQRRLHHCCVPCAIESRCHFRCHHRGHRPRRTLLVVRRPGGTTSAERWNRWRRIGPTPRHRLPCRRGNPGAAGGGCGGCGSQPMVVVKEPMGDCCGGAAVVAPAAVGAGARVSPGGLPMSNAPPQIGIARAGHWRNGIAVVVVVTAAKVRPCCSAALKRADAKGR